MSTYSDQINVVINERLLPKMQNLSMQIANIEPYSYSSTELEDYKRQLDYYSMIYDFLNEYALGTEELDNAKLVNIVRLVDAPSQERKSSNYLSTSISKALKAKTGYKLYLNKTEITPDTIITPGTVISITVIYTDTTYKSGDQSIHLTSGVLDETSDGWTISIQNKIIPLSLDGTTLTIFAQAKLDGAVVNAGQTYTIPIGHQIQTVTDADGNIYNIATIGTHTWMLQNLKTTKYRNGDPIPNITNFADWYLPSKDELNLIYTNLYLQNIGGYSGPKNYLSSSEYDSANAWRQYFLTGGQDAVTKYEPEAVAVIPIRSFTSSVIFELGAPGPAGGWIFNIIVLGGGSFTYYEVAPKASVILNVVWSDVSNQLLGTTGTAVGTGQANTTAIINQHGGAHDWFLPSQDELAFMYSNLKVFGIGGFANDFYWSSYEISDTTALSINFLGGIQLSTDKVVTNHVRACRSFTTNTIYNLRDVGPAGGWIFDIINNGGGSFTYYEAAPVNQSIAQEWSNVNNVFIGTTGSTVGTGITNTPAIVAQVGHIDSAAQLCINYDNSFSSITSAALDAQNFTDNILWTQALTGAYCWNNNDIANKTPYGALYNWFAVNDSRNIAPTGWHVATQTEWADLVTLLGGDIVAGGKLKEVGTAHWVTPNPATNDVNFTALPTGYRDGAVGTFYSSFGIIGYYWSSTPFDGNNSFMFHATKFDTSLETADFLNQYGMAVRCVKD